MGTAIQGKVILFVTRSLWDEPHRGRHHLAEKLSEANEVLWVNRFTRLDEGYGRKVWRAQPRLRILHPGSSWLTPRFDRIWGDFKDWLRLRWCANWMQCHQVSPDLVWIHDYAVHQFAKYYKRRGVPVLYYCNDYFGDGWRETREATLAEQADWVFITAPRLRERFEDVNSSIYFVPHAVADFEWPATFSKKPEPRMVGYVGTIRSQLETRIFEQVLEETPCDILLVGPMVEMSEADKSWWHTFIQLSRVNCLGAKPKDEIRSFMGQADILLLPYRQNVKSLYRFPLKYFEYLSVGRPIIANDFCNWEPPYDQYVTVARDGESISEAMQRAWGLYDEQDWRRRIRFAKENTWDARLRQIADLLQLGDRVSRK